MGDDDEAEKDVDNQRLEFVEITSDNIPPKGVDMDNVQTGENHTFSTGTQPGVKLPDHMCKPELLANIGYSIRMESESTKLSMCPQVKYSCCRIQDQKIIYQMWEFQEEHKLLKERFEWYTKVYRDFYKMAQRVQFWSERVAHVLQKRPISNCKILTTKISQFQLEYVFPKILEALHIMFESFEFTYKGMYCAMCDSIQHDYINVQREEVYVSTQSCR